MAGAPDPELRRAAVRRRVDLHQKAESSDGVALGKGKGTQSVRQGMGTSSSSDKRPESLSSPPSPILISIDLAEETQE